MFAPVKKGKKLVEMSNGQENKPKNHGGDAEFLQMRARIEIRWKMERVGGGSLTPTSAVLMFNEYTKSFI